MKIGVIYVGFNTEEYIAGSLGPWLEARASRLDGHEYVIAAVSVPFVGFDVGEMDHTYEALQLCKHTGKIDWLLAGTEPMKETEARGHALKWLVAQGVTHIVQWDSDEFPTTEQLSAILRFVAARPFVDFFRISYKNLVFTPDQYLAEPFTPPRIHKVHNGSGFLAAGFHQDNGVYYERPWSGERVLDTQLTSCTVPKHIAFVRHASWLNNSRSRRKISYQAARGWPNCTFAWDDTQGGLIWNPALPIPETARDSS